MGAITFSIDLEFVECLRDSLALEVFVETGTFEGEAVERVRPLFSEIHTIELSLAYFERAKAQFGSAEGVSVYHGDSREVLRSLRERLERRPVLYWLDAHWCAESAASGGSTPCPLLGELEAVGTLNLESVVLIDDARLFIATPPAPHDVADWPRFDQVLQRLTQMSTGHELMVINDVIAFFPSSLAARLSSYAHCRGFDLLATIHRLEGLEQECGMLRNVAAERLTALEEKEREIAALSHAAHERLAALEEKEREIAALTHAASERLETIEGIAVTPDVESTAVAKDRSSDRQT
jgi:hypothetical protein